MKTLRHTSSIGCGILFSLLLTCGLAFAGSLSLPQFFSDHMVLQREVPAAIRGTAAPEAPVTVSFKGNEVGTESDSEDNWRTDDWDDVISEELIEEAKAREERRALGAEIRAINAKRKTVDRGSDEYEALTEKVNKLKKKFRATE